MKRIIINLSLFAALALSVSSCFLDTKANIITKENFYNSESEVLYGLVGVYGAMNHESFYGNKYSLMLTNIDDLSYYNRPDAKSNPTVRFNHDASAPEIYEAWTRIYKGIANANSFMEGVAACEFDKDGAFYAEARFLRAYYHFILAQSWGDVPQKTQSTPNPESVYGAAVPQAQILDWVIDEMLASLENISDDVAATPSRATKTVAQGVLARVCLFAAGESVKGGARTKEEYLTLARDNAQAVILSGKHALNPSYEKVFQNMIADAYDTEYHESMWEVEFKGNRSSADQWSNGRIGDLIGLQSTGSTDYSTFNCNYSYGMYNGTLKLWDLYWDADRTDDEKCVENTISDVRQNWNMSPYNYSGNKNQRPYGSAPDTIIGCEASIDKTPYVYKSVSTNDSPVAAPAIRNCGKYRRETIYEPVQNAKHLYTQINYPLLRYSDVLLMYAEASNELDGLTQEAYDAVKAVRTRAGIKTRDFGEYSTETFRELVRNERARELCFESLRKFDLIRWGIFVQEMNGLRVWTADDRWCDYAYVSLVREAGAAVQPKHVLLPIPTVELGVNTKLSQNPLWL